MQWLLAVNNRKNRPLPYNYQHLQEPSEPRPANAGSVLIGQKRGVGRGQPSGFA